MRDVVIVSGTRTPIGDFGGSLKDVSAISLATTVIESSIKRAGIEKGDVEMVVMGNCFEPLDQNIARIAAVKCGLPVEVPASSVIVNCASGMHAIICGIQAIRDGDVDVVINVQGDEPFLKTEPLKQLIQVFKNDVDKEISLASLKIRLKNQEEVENPNNVKVITDLQNFAMYFSRSVIPYPRETSVEHLYYKHIGVYAFRKEALLKFANLAMTPLEISEKIEVTLNLEKIHLFA